MKALVRMGINSLWTARAQREVFNTRTVIEIAEVMVMVIQMSCLASVLYIVSEDATKIAIYVRAWEDKANCHRVRQREGNIY